MNFQVDVAAVGPNLDVKLELWKEVTGYGGRTYVEQVAVEDPGFRLSARMNCEVTAGKYYLLVTSHGEFGDVGQYTLSGEVPPYYLLDHGIAIVPGYYLRPEFFAQPYPIEPRPYQYATKPTDKTPVFLDASKEFSNDDLAFVDTKAAKLAVASANPEKTARDAGRWSKSYEEAIDLSMASDIAAWAIPGTGLW